MKSGDADGQRLTKASPLHPRMFSFKTADRGAGSLARHPSFSLGDEFYSQGRAQNSKATDMNTSNMAPGETL